MKTVSVIGLGYIGLPTASMFATHGYKVRGVDANQKVVSILKEGRIHIEEPGLATVVKAAISSGNLDVQSKPSEADVFIIAVPTPYLEAHSDIPKADMSFVMGALESIIPVLKKGNLVILESTSPPGTTRDLLIPRLEKAGFKPGSDIGVAYCPERVIPGKALEELIGNDRVVGAVTQEWGEITKSLYKSFVSGDIFITEPTVAEMVKVIENTFRDVNIALANEVTILCERLGISVWKVIQLANRHPRVNIHKPGPGVGGHCISVDPWFLVEKFPEDTKIIHQARKINDSMPAYVVKKLDNLISSDQKAKIAILGLTYKGNVDDIRESPALVILKLLKEKYPKAEVVVHDPHVKSDQFATVGLEAGLKGADVSLLLSAHDEFKEIDPVWAGALMNKKIMIDTHNWLDSTRWKSAGFQLMVLGDGRSRPHIEGPDS